MNASKVVCCVRNPLDVVTSMFNFWATQTQSKSIEEQNYFQSDSPLKPYWDALVKQELTAWRDFHNYWIERKDVPIYFFRYEDLTNDPKATLTKIF